jgi:hypothetical protein
MSTTLMANPPCYLRNRVLGSEAVYEVLSEEGGCVTVEVIYAPGLEAGTRLRILARAAAAMERLEPATAEAARRSRFTDSLPGAAGRFAGTAR